MMQVFAGRTVAQSWVDLNMVALTPVMLTEVTIRSADPELDISSDF